MQNGIIEADLDNLTSLAESWLAAKEAEKAVIILEKASKIDETGESDLKYGRVLFGLEKWKQASEPLTNSMQKLKGKQIGAASLLLGMTQFHLKNLSEAKVYFSKAISYENERSQAGQWLRHVDAQLKAENKDES